MAKQAPKLKRMFYDVHLLPLGDDKKPDEDGTPESFEVEVRYGDQTRGELEAAKNRIATPDKAPVANQGCWVWAALTRTGQIKDGYQSFAARALVIKGRKGSDGQPEVEEVRPTPEP